MTQWKVLFDVSKNHLLSRKKQTITASLGVTFGIGTFIILVSFMTGLNGLLDGLILNRTPHIRLYNEIKPSKKQPIELAEAVRTSFQIVHSVKPKESQVRIHNALPIIQYLRKDKRVKGVSPQVKAQVFYMAGSLELNGVVNGLEVMEDVRLFNFDEYIIEGSPKALARNSNGILLGAGIADKLSLQVGDRVTLNSAQGGIFPLKIVGIFQSGLAEIDNIQSYVNIKTAQKILGEGKNYISDIHIKLWELDKVETIATTFSRQFNISALDINRANAQFETGSTIRNLITYSVSITLLIVAGFGIYNILNMMIYEKMKDIAILKATGFSGKDVQRIFLSQALIIGIAGGLIGLVLGYVVSVLISHTPFETDALPTIKTYPVNFNPQFYIIGIVFAIISTFLAGYLPSLKAKKIDPVDIIRRQ